LSSEGQLDLDTSSATGIIETVERALPKVIKAWAEASEVALARVGSRILLDLLEPESRTCGSVTQQAVSSQQ
jgi:hypothetical protein